MNINLKSENEKLISSQKTINLMLKVMSVATLSSMFAPVLLSILIFNSGLIASGTTSFWTAAIITVVVAIPGLYYVAWVIENAKNVRNDSEAILSKFDEVVKDLDRRRYFVPGQRLVVNQEAVHQSLVAMARDVLDAEGLEKYARETMKLNPVNDTYGIFNGVCDKRQKLENALSRQSLFGFVYSKRELFQEAESKNK